MKGARKPAGAPAGRPAATAIDAYLAQLAPARRVRGEALHRLVLKHFPDAVAGLQHGMPHYRVGDAFFAWGSQKSCLSVYTCSVERLRRFRSRHPGVLDGIRKTPVVPAKAGTQRGATKDAGFPLSR